MARAPTPKCLAVLRACGVGELGLVWCGLSSGDLVGEAAFSAAKRYSPLNRECTFHICTTLIKNRPIGQTDFPLSLFSTSEDRRPTDQASLEREGGREKNKYKMMVVHFFFRSCLGWFRCPMAKKEKLIASSAGPTKEKQEARRGRGNAPYTLPPPPPFLPPVSLPGPLPLNLWLEFRWRNHGPWQIPHCVQSALDGRQLPIARLGLSRLTSLAAAVRATHHARGWGCSSWMINDSPLTHPGVIHMRLICQNDIVASVTRSHLHVP
jgi:hypothetical protein